MNFRSAYRKLSILRTTFPSIPIIACTVTPKVSEDIINHLRLRKNSGLLIVKNSFDRQNLIYKFRTKRKRFNTRYTW